VENVDASKLKETGAITFNADGTYRVMFTISGSVNETVAAACLTSGTTSLTCDEFSALIQAATTSSSDAAFSGVSCHGSSSCACSFAYATTTMTESGTYTTAGATITTTPTSGDPETQSYCVQGSTMTVASNAMATMMDGMSTMTGESDLRVQLTLKKR
jgi:hypothetical protein